LKALGFTGTFVGDGVVANWFDAVTAGVGLHEISFMSENENGCKDTALQSIRVMPLPVANILDNTSPVCENSEAFPLAGSVIEGVYGYYIGDGVSNGQFHASIVNVGAHDVGYVAVSEFECTDTAFTSIVVNEVPSIGILANPETVVYGATSILTATVTGGSNEGYVVSWLPSDSIASSSVFEAQTVPLHKANIMEAYAVDSRNCQSEKASVVVGVSGSPLFAEADLVSVCENDSSRAMILASGGSGVYSYSWSPTIGLSSSSVANPYIYGINAENAYSVTVTDTKSNEEYVVFVSVDKKSAPYLSISADTSICSGSQVTIQVSGADTYVWDNGLMGESSYVVKPLVETTYHVIGKLDNGCSESGAVKIGVYEKPEKPGISYQGESTICQGDSVKLQVNAVNGYEYIWNNASIKPVQYVKNTGKYAVQYKSSDGCYSKPSDTITIVVDAIPEQPVVSVNGELKFCAGDSVQLSVNASDPLLWSTGESANTIYPKKSGIYTAVAKNASGCVSKSSEPVAVSVEQLPVAPLINASGIQPICAGDSIKLTASIISGYIYEWSSGENTISIYAKQAGTYSVKYRSVLGCMSKSSESVTVKIQQRPDKPTIYPTGNIVSCNNESVLLSSSNGSGYEWSNGQTTNSIIVQSSGEFSVKTINEYGCTSENSETVAISIVPKYSITVSDDVKVCSKSSVSLFAEGAKSYSWSSGDVTSEISIVPENSGYVYVTASDANNCSVVDSILVTLVDQPEIGLVAPDQVCKGETFTATTSGLPVVWNGSIEGKTFTLVAEEDTTIKAFYTDGVCIAKDSVVVNVVDVPTVELGDKIDACEGTAKVLTAETNTSSYLWNTGQKLKSIVVEKTGTYSVTVTEGNCSAVDVVNVEFHAAPSISLTAKESECGGATGEVSAYVKTSRNVEYNWASVPADNLDHIAEEMRDTAVLKDLSAGMYILVANDGICGATKSVIVNDHVAEAVLEDVQVDKTFICKGDSVSLTAIGSADSYIWYPDYILNTNAGSSVMAYPDTSTVFIISALYGECVVSKSVFVGVDEIKDVQIEDMQKCKGEPLTYVLNGFDSYAWSTGCRTSSFVTDSAGTYSVTVSKGACNAEKSFVVSDYEMPEYTINTVSPSCGVADGSITINSEVTLDYFWSDKTVGRELKSVASGVYAVSISDGICSAKETISLSNLETEAIAIVSDKKSVLRGETVTVSSKTEADQIEWYVNGSAFGIGQSLDIPVFANIEIRAEATSGECLSFGTAEVAVLKDFAVDLGRDTTICFGSSLVLDAGEGDSYEWNTGDVTRYLSVVEPGSYAVTVTKGYASGIGYIDVTLDESTTIEASVSAASCGTSDGEIVIANYNTEAKYFVNGDGMSSHVLSGLTPGLYEITIEKGQCTTSKKITVPTKNSLVSVEIKQLDQCTGEYSFVASGADSYTWSTENGAVLATVAEVSGVVAESEELYVKAVVGDCEYIESVSIERKDTPLTSLKDNYTLCLPGDLSVTAGPGRYEYRWSTGESGAIAAIKEPGEYSVTVSYNGCASVDAFTVTASSIADVSINVVDADCGVDNGSITISGESVKQVIWQSGEISSTLKNVSAGIYPATIESGVCSVTENIVVNAVGASELKVKPSATEACVGSSVSVSASGAETFIWTKADGSVIGTDASTTIDVEETLQYFVEGKTGACSAFGVFDLVAKPLPSVRLDIEDVLCFGQEPVTLSSFPIGGALSVDGNIVSTMIPSAIGVGEHLAVYEYTAPKTGCVNSVSKIVTVDNPVDFDIANFKEQYCQGETITPIATPQNVQITLNGESITSFSTDNLDNGDVIDAVFTYTKEGSGCSYDYYMSSDYVKKPIGSFDFFVDKTTVGFVNNVDYADNYSWSFGDGSTGIDENPKKSYANYGSYSVVLTVGNDACGTVDIKQSLQLINTSLESDDTSFDITIEPNPAISYFVVKASKEINSVRILSSSGVEYEARRMADAKLPTFEVVDLPTGVYQVLINIDGFIVHKALIIE